MLRSPRRTDKGRLRVDGVLTRAGIFTYDNADGTARRELRPPEEVFRADALASLEVIPLVDDHPRSGLLGNDSSRAQGWTSEGMRRDGDLVVGPMVFIDPALIAKIEGGKTSLSVGYEVDYDPTPGTHPTYGSYDGIQRNIRGDHVAVVDAGRAGPEARVRMDSSAEDAPLATIVPSHLTGARAPATLPIGASNDMTPEQILELQKAFTAAIARADALETENKALKSRCDTAEGAAESLKVVNAKLASERTDAGAFNALTAKVEELEIDLKAAKARADRAEDPKTLTPLVLERVRIEGAALSVLGPAFRCDGSTDRAIMEAVVSKISGTVEAGKSDEYVRARFDVAVQGFLAYEKAIASVKESASNVSADVRLDTRSPRQKYVDSQRTLYTPPNAGAKE
jgi:hypothetical protein